MASTRGSDAAWVTSSSTEAANESYGCCTRMSPLRIRLKMFMRSPGTEASSRGVTQTYRSHLRSGRSRSYTPQKPVMSRGPSVMYTCSGPMASSRSSSRSASSLMLGSTSRRTTRPNLLRLSSLSMNSSRSSASSSSMVMSALRVTRNATWETISIPGKSDSRWAAITSSSAMIWSPPGRTRNRGRIGGTLTRANLVWPVDGSRTVTPRLRDMLER